MPEAERLLTSTTFEKEPKHNLVLSWPVAADLVGKALKRLSLRDRLAPYSGPYFNSSGFKGFLFYLLGVFLIWIYSYFGGICSFCEHCCWIHSSGCIDIVFGFYFIWGPLSFLHFIVRPVVPPTNLLVGQDGLVFQWCHKKTINSPLLYFWLVEQASIGQDERLAEAGSSAGKYVRLKINHEHMSFGLRSFFSTYGRLLGDVNLSWWSFSPRCDMQISLDAFTREADRELFLSLIRKNLPAKYVDQSIDKELLYLTCKNSLSDSPLQSAGRTAGGSSSSPDHGFTNMWLDDVNSFRRRSIEPLCLESRVDEGRYEVVERLATGGQAVVYRAVDTYLDPPMEVVLKEFVLPVGAGSSVRKRSFESVSNEVALLSSLDHKGIVRFLDYFIEDHRAYLVLENIEGETIRDRVLTCGPFSSSQADKIVDSMCEILDYLHGQSPPIVHRDLSPDNFMIKKNGSVKLIDFNVALQEESVATRTVVGKHNYMAPEQFQGNPVPQSDLYSLGATIGFMLTGLDPTPLTCIVLPCDCPFRQMVEKLTCLDLTCRYQSVRDVIKESGASVRV